MGQKGKETDLCFFIVAFLLGNPHPQNNPHPSSLKKIIIKGFQCKRETAGAAASHWHHLATILACLK